MTSQVLDSQAVIVGCGRRSRILPLWLKLAFTVFMVVLVPSYWKAYGPTNFLYFCDVALFFALVSVWTEHRILASAPAVGILLPQLIWCVDFFGRLLSGSSIFGMTDYMFDPNIALFYRSLSLFHGWLPFLLLYLVAKLGYDRRALPVWTLASWTLLIVCYVWMPAPPARMEAGMYVPANINYVYGMSENAAQTLMHPHLWFLLLMVGLPLFVYYPTHWILNRWRNRSAV